MRASDIYRRITAVNDYFISRWNTANLSAGSSTSTQVRLPLSSSGTYNFTITWSDGTSYNITSWNQAEVTKTFSGSGTYTAVIQGICTGFNFSNLGDRLKILEIQQWGRLKFINAVGQFWGCANLNVIATDIPDLSGLSSLESFFRECSSLVYNPSINNWNVLGIDSMDFMFFLATPFNQPIANWNVSTVTKMIFMFSTNTFNQPIGNWNVANVTRMDSMFRNNGVFNQPINTWNVGSVINMPSMFQGAPGFNQPIGNWNVSNVMSFASFMLGKAPANYSAVNLDLIYNGWSTRPVLANRTISFGTIKHTAAGTAGKAILTGAPNNWTITDGGI